MTDIGCGDNSCIFNALRSPGMGTNGGCRCFDELVTWSESERRWNRDEVHRVERFARMLAQELRTARKEAEDYRQTALGLTAALKALQSPAEACRTEREKGKGGCGACSLCCLELREELERARFKHARLLSERL